MEGSHSIVTEPATVRAEYQSQLKRFLDKLRDDCHEFNADYRRVTLDQPYDQVLADFLTERARPATRPTSFSRSSSSRACPSYCCRESST